MLVISRVLGTVGLLMLIACQSKHLSSEALVKYVNDPTHRLRQVQQVGSTEVSVTYQPVDLLVARDLPVELHKQSALDSLRKKYSSSTFFLLSIARNGREVLQPKEGFSNYSMLLQTLAFQMREHVLLTTSQGDTLQPSNYYLDRTYASAGATQLLFAFPALPTAGTWRFRLLECGLGTGNLTFSFDASSLRDTPALLLAD